MEEKHVFINGNYNVGDRIDTGKKHKKDRSKGRRGLSVAALVIFSITFAVLCAAFIYLDSKGIIPEDLFFKILIGVGVFVLLEILILLLSKKSGVLSVLSMLLCIAVVSASAFGAYALYQLYESLQEVEDPKVYYAYAGLYVKKNGIYAPKTVEEKNEKTGEVTTEIIPGESLEGRTVGTMLLNLDTGYTSQAMRILRRNTDVKVNVYEDFGSMVDALREGEIDAFLFSEAYMNIFLDSDSDFFEWATERENIGLETENKTVVKKAEVTTEPFVVYIAGLDTTDTDSFPNIARTDTNILAFVNPVTKKILLVNTPRDYYVPLWGRSYAMDKLTHAGVYGLDCTLDTLEAFYGIDINYYVKTNVYSVIKIVDALGGVTVHCDYKFSAPNGLGGTYYFEVGENDIDGKSALCFVRERSSFANGDRQRGIHQEELIRAVIRKACSPAIVAHFTDVLKVVESSVRTNITQEEINALIKMQLTDMASWSVEGIAVDGYGSITHSYALGSDAWMMIPYTDTVNEAKQKIAEFMAG